MWKCNVWKLASCKNTDRSGSITGRSVMYGSLRVVKANNELCKSIEKEMRGSLMCRITNTVKFHFF